MTRIILLEGKEVVPVPKRFGHCDAELVGVGDHDITEFDITESDVTFFQEFDITESDITEKGNFYNGIRYNGICYNMKLEIGITKFVTVESDITGKWKLI